MKPLYTQAEFDTAKSRDLLPLECPQCGQTFHKAKHFIQLDLSPNRNRKQVFCSRLCSNQAHFSSVVVSCEQCGNPFKKQLSQIKQSKYHFCSQTCAAKYHNNHKTTGTRVSKLERWLQEQLLILFPGLEFHFNRTDAINAELDIYVPYLHLAFELNGIFHYEPIYGIKKLSSVMTNDYRKMLACAEHGIELCVIDISHVSYFKPAKAQKFLDIVTNILQVRLMSQ